LDLWEPVKDASERAGEQEVQQKVFHPEGYIQIRGARSLDPTGKSVLRALYLFRDHEARRRNRAPFRVLSDETLVRLAVNRPKSLNDFVRVKGLPRPFHNSRSAGHVLSVIRKWENLPEEANADP
jgi:ribonuclease D